MNPSIRLLTAAGAVYLTIVATAACGSHGPGFGDPAGTASDASPADPQADASSGFGGGDAGGGGGFASDDGSAAVTGGCQPGTYTGTFDTKVTNDAGGLFSLFSIAWSGTLTIELQGQTSSTGGELPTTTLTIAPGAKVDGTDAYNGRFLGDLSGQLDCATRTLSGTLSNAEYIFAGDSGSLPLTGVLSGTYYDEGGAPVLSGAITISSSSALGGSSADGTWTASLH